MTRPGIGALPGVRAIGPARLTAGLDRIERLDLHTHRSIHGVLTALAFEQLVAFVEQIKLTGRGGAGFPFARKLSAVMKTARDRATGTIVVVNATEGEPASWKDKVLLARTPHLILDGATLVAQALGAHRILIAVADGEAGGDSMRQAVAERRMPAQTRVVTVPGRFISGESGALVKALNGEVPIPPGRKVLASESGVDGMPTLLSNAETFAQLAVAVRLGPLAYAGVGTRDEPGTVLLTIGGSAIYPSVVETPTGVRLADLLRTFGAAVGPGVLTGGYHGKWLTPETAAQALISRADLDAVGGTLGAGIILPLGDDTCPLGEAAQVVQYLSGEAAGQCGPCRRGLPQIARTLAALAAGTATPSTVDLIRTAATGVRGRGACAHPDGVSRFALSTLTTFTEDVTAHLEHGGCGQPVRGVLPMPASAGSGSRLSVDWTRCDGHGLCAHIMPEFIQLDGNGYPAFPDTPVPAWLESHGRKAVSRCPALALRLAPAGATPPGSRPPAARAARH